MRRGKVRRAKLYYLRGLRGKRARITEKQDHAPTRGRRVTAGAATHRDEHAERRLLGLASAAHRAGLQSRRALSHALCDDCSSSEPVSAGAVSISIEAARRPIGGRSRPIILVRLTGESSSADGRSSTLQNVGRAMECPPCDGRSRR